MFTQGQVANEVYGEQLAAGVPNHFNRTTAYLTGLERGGERKENPEEIRHSPLPLS